MLRDALWFRLLHLGCRTVGFCAASIIVPSAEASPATETYQVQTTFVTLVTHTHTHTRLTALCPGLPRWAGTRKVKPIWILLKQETVSGSGTGWAICKSAPRSRDNHTSTSPLKVFYRPDAVPAAKPTVSKHWRQYKQTFVTMTMKYNQTNLGQTTVQRPMRWHHLSILSKQRKTFRSLVCQNAPSDSR